MFVAFFCSKKKQKQRPQSQIPRRESRSNNDDTTKMPPSNICVVVLCGLPGAGKSTFCSALKQSMLDPTIDMGCLGAAAVSVVSFDDIWLGASESSVPTAGDVSSDGNDTTVFTSSEGSFQSHPIHPPIPAFFSTLEYTP
jgi:GTPase SAR1 family protein